MKFYNTFAPIASLALVVSGESPQESTNYSKPVTFNQGGLEKVLDAKVNGPSGDIQGAVQSVKGFFKRNPDVLKSIMKVVNDPKNTKAKSEAISEGMKLHSEYMTSKDIPAVKVKTINYIYKHPELIKLAEDIGNQVIKDHPTLVDNYYSSLAKVAEKNPGLFREVKDQIIDFGDKNPESYEKVVEMVLRAGIKNPKLAAKVTKRVLEINQIVCTASGSSDCSCDDGSGGDANIDPYEPEVEEPNNVEPYEPEVEEPNNVDPYEPEVEEPNNVDPYEPEVEEPNNVDPYEPEVEEPNNVDPYEPEEVGYVRPELKSPEVNSEVPEVEAPEVDSEIPEIEETTEPEVEAPEVNSEVPEVPEVENTSEPEPESLQYRRPQSAQPTPINKD